jgi:hypothetical protein
MPLDILQFIFLKHTIYYVVCCYNILISWTELLFQEIYGFASFIQGPRSSLSKNVTKYREGANATSQNAWCVLGRLILVPAKQRITATTQTGTNQSILWKRKVDDFLRATAVRMVQSRYRTCVHLFFQMNKNALRIFNSSRILEDT